MKCTTQPKNKKIKNLRNVWPSAMVHADQPPASHSGSRRCCAVTISSPGPVSLAHYPYPASTDIRLQVLQGTSLPIPSDSYLYRCYPQIWAMGKAGRASLAGCAATDWSHALCSILLPHHTLSLDHPKQRRGQKSAA